MFALRALLPSPRRSLTRLRLNHVMCLAVGFASSDLEMYLFGLDRKAVAAVDSNELFAIKTVK